MKVLSILMGSILFPFFVILFIALLFLGLNIPLNEMNNHLAEIPKDKPFILHCAGGYRSVIAASLLKRHGYHNLRNVLGGFGKIKEEKRIPIVHPDKVKI
jgi:rhodanese-related sulfurtransferase